jgi:hypothetical protein
MKKQFGYVRTIEMDPRPGTKFSTVYYRQTPIQRGLLSEFFVKCIKEIGEEINRNPGLYSWLDEPLKGFTKTRGQSNRSFTELIEDTVGEIRGRKKDGTHKDYAQAPIDRWNKLFKDSEYEFEMVETHQHVPTTIAKLFDNV